MRHSRRRPDPRFTRPGPLTVVLEAAPGTPLTLVRAVMRTSGRRLRAAIAFVETGGDVSVGIDDASADAVRRELEDAGGTVSVVEGGHPQATPMRSPLDEQLVRALPVGLLALVGVLMASGGGWLSVIGAAELAIAAVFVSRASWRRYVRTGLRPVATPAAIYTEPGPNKVMLVGVGPGNAKAVAAVRRTTGRSLLDAAKLVEKGGAVALGVSAASAAVIVAELAPTGVRTEIVGPDALGS